MRPAVTRAGLAAAFTNVTLSALYLAFGYAQVQSFRVHPRASALLVVAVETLFALFFLLRRSASAASTSKVACVSSMCGTFLPLLLRPSAAAEELLAAELVQAAGLAFAVAGILSLNTSVGLLPANRGVRTTGAYRAVRHPLYAAYLVRHGRDADRPHLRRGAAALERPRVRRVQAAHSLAARPVRLLRASLDADAPRQVERARARGRRRLRAVPGLVERPHR
jgi:protein-S-isoprenylcysteine O-methyltransferase Ste14